MLRLVRALRVEKRLVLGSECARTHRTCGDRGTLGRATLPGGAGRARSSLRTSFTRVLTGRATKPAVALGHGGERAAGSGAASRTSRVAGRVDDQRHTVVERRPPRASREQRERVQDLAAGPVLALMEPGDREEPAVQGEIKRLARARLPALEEPSAGTGDSAAAPLASRKPGAQALSTRRWSCARRRTPFAPLGTRPQCAARARARRSIGRARPAAPGSAPRSSAAGTRTQRRARSAPPPRRRSASA
jgi:hypothetical protein